MKLNPEKNLAELLDEYPELEVVLFEEFGIHCAMCPMQGYDSLKEAASYHEIEGEDLNEMLEFLEEKIKEIETSD